jgi:hypothetical protein
MHATALLLALFVLVASVSAAPLVVYKQLSSDLVGVGVPLTVSLVVYNTQPGALTSVHLNDSHNWDPAFFAITEGTPLGTVDRIESGSTANVSFTVVPLAETSLTAGTAVVDATLELLPEASDDSASAADVQMVPVKAYSNFVPPYPVYGARRYAVEASTKQYEWAVFAVVALLPTVLPALLYIVMRGKRIEQIVRGEKKRA